MPATKGAYRMGMLLFVCTLTYSHGAQSDTCQMDDAQLRCTDDPYEPTLQRTLLQDAETNASITNDTANMTTNATTNGTANATSGSGEGMLPSLEAGWPGIVNSIFPESQPFEHAGVIPASSPGIAAVGLLWICYASGQCTHCTGALIKPDAVLTAAHCFYDITAGASKPTKPENVRFFPRLTLNADHQTLNSPTGDPDLPSSGIKVKTIDIDLDYEYGVLKDPPFYENRGSDIALVKLEKPVIDPGNVFVLKTSCDVRAPNNGLVATTDDVRTAGYPRDGRAANSKAHVMMAESRCTIPDTLDGNCKDRILRNRCSTLPGSSGGPIYKLDNSNPPRAILFGIVSGGEYIGNPNEGGKEDCVAQGGEPEFTADPDICVNVAAELDEVAETTINFWYKGYT